MAKFGELVRRHRTQRQMSLDKLATATGLSRAYLWKLEKKPDANPSLRIVEMIASALETTPADLLPSGEDSRVPSDIPASLASCKAEYDLTDADVADLARVRFRGGHPTSADDWYALFLQLRRAVGSTRDE